VKRRCSRRLPSSSARYSTSPCAGLISPKVKRSLVTAIARSSIIQLLPTFGLPANSATPSGTSSGTTNRSGSKVIRCNCAAVTAPSIHQSAAPSTLVRPAVFASAADQTTLKSRSLSAAANSSAIRFVTPSSPSSIRIPFASAMPRISRAASPGGILPIATRCPAPRTAAL
jgi:hypothetical protein